MLVSRRRFGIGMFSFGALSFRRSEAAPTHPGYELIRFYIAGFQYHGGPQVLSQMTVGDGLVLQTEPDNRHDPKAIRLEWQGCFVGYVPRSQNRLLCRLLAQGARLRGEIVQVSVTAPSWEAVKVRVHLLPEPVVA